MMPTWHQPVSMSGYTRESETAKNRNYMQLPSPMPIHLFVNSTTASITIYVIKNRFVIKGGYVIQQRSPQIPKVPHYLLIL